MHQATHNTKTPADIHENDTSNEYEEAERNYNLRSAKFWTIVLGMYLVIFLVALDRSIIAAAIPRITDEFNSIGDVAWYGSAYTLTCACFCPISGRVYQLFATKPTFLLSISVFEAGSALCGAAPNSVVLICGRATAGIGAAFITSGGVMILQPFIPLRKRPVFVSLFGLSFGVASVTGPIIGGLLTDHITWRWCFYLNLPIGGFTMIAISLLFHIPSSSGESTSMLSKLSRLDPIGIALFVPSMISLILALTWGGSVYPWSAPRIIGLFVAFGTLLVGFVIVEIQIPDTAMLPTRIVLNRSVLGSMLYMFLGSGSAMSLIYYLTYWFQTVKDTSATQAGIRTLPLIVPFALVGILAATVTQKLGRYTPALLFAPFPCSIGAGLLSTLSPSSDAGRWIGYQLLFGVGIGSGYQNSQLPPQNVLHRVDVPLGMGLIYFVQQLGGTIFLAIGQNVLLNTLIHDLSGVQGLDVPAIVNSGATDLRRNVPSDKVGIVVAAYNHALVRTFLVSAAASAVMTLGALLVENKKIKDQSTNIKVSGSAAGTVRVGEKEAQPAR